ncbi:MAG: hypothetical protein O7J95_05320 [Planctomycetota bacterium]|nr:hypothetical protein [Planctomycetota bacterium]
MNWDKVLRPEILVFVVGGLIAIVAIVSSAMKSFATAKLETRLKERLLDQGMSVDEIERILLAGKELTTEEKKAEG